MFTGLFHSIYSTFFLIDILERGEQIWFMYCSEVNGSSTS